MLVITSPYIPQLVEAVKSLPYTERRYDGTRKVWLVDPKHGDKLVVWIKMYTGEVTSLPSITQYTGGAVMRLLEVRYIGACKLRDDGSSAAFGLVGKDWSVIFPEAVLRNWFDSGEPELSKEQTLYQVLGIKKAVDAEEIRSAYRRMVKIWHPDTSKEPNSTEIFLRIQEAYEVLSNINKRARYDAGLILQASFEKGNNPLIPKSNYRSPLRSGTILLDGIEKIGRIEVTQIYVWEDIVNSKGQVLVVSWPAGAKQPDEKWV